MMKEEKRPKKNGYVGIIGYFDVVKQKNTEGTRRGSPDEKEKMEQSFVDGSGDGDSYITFVRLRREEREKRRRRNDHGVFMDHKPV